MNWVIESLLGVAFFVLTQILGKQSWRAGVPCSVINLATYIVVVFVFLAAGVVSDLEINAPLVLLAVLASACIYVGNAASVRGFNYAPNGGYGTAIVKSYVVITVAASIFLFGGEFDWKKLLGVALILASQLLIVANGKREKMVAGSHWAKYSFTALFAYAGLSMIVEYAIVMGVNQLAFLFWAIVGSLIFFAAEIWIRKISILNFKKQTGSLLLLGVASGIGNIFMWNAFAHAPNMGYVNAISTINVAIISLLAVKLFGDEATKQKSLGIAGVTAGLLLIVLS